MGEMLHAALAYAAAGWHVFPCLPPDAAACREMEPRKRGKTPACAHGKDDATTDFDAIRKWWWWDNPNYNIGVRTGKESGFFVVDVDGDKGASELKKLEDQFGQLPPTLESITGGGGRHLCFQIGDYPIRNSTSALAPKIDVRAIGGCIVAPPSLHGLGRRYAWSADGADSPAPAPSWIIERATRAKFTAKVVAGGRPEQARLPVEWVTAFAEPIPEGTRDDTLARISGYLLRPFVTIEIIRLVNAARCVPPLPDCDLDRIVNSIVGKELRRRAGFGR